MLAKSKFMCYFVIILSCTSGLYVSRHTLNSRRIRADSLHGTRRTVSIPADIDTKERIDSYLASQFSDISRSAFGSLCEEGKVFVNSKAGNRHVRYRQVEVRFTKYSSIISKEERKNFCRGHH